MPDLHVEETLYSNPLATAADCADWMLEGDGLLSFPRQRLRLESSRPMSEGQAANIVFWCPQRFPDHIRISWNFQPLHEPGLAMLFYAASARSDGGSIFPPHCAERNGPYDQYHHGDINALHVSYFRRRNPTELQFRTCNLRKSHGFHLVAQGADPLPEALHAHQPYRISVLKSGPFTSFAINDLSLFTWHDPGTAATGPVLGSGYLGFRSMSPMIAEYHDLKVERIRPLLCE